MSQPLRILHVFALLDRGGAETMIMNIYRQLDKNKVQFDFIVHTSVPGAYEAEIQSYGGRIYRVPKYKGINHIAYVRAWNTFFHQHPEHPIVHGHIRSTAAIYLGIAKRMQRTTIAHSHSTNVNQGILRVIKRIYQYPIRYIADGLLSCSQEAGEWLFGKAAYGAKHHIFPTPIDTHRFAFNPSQRQVIRSQYQLEQRLTIGHIGRFDTAKNQTMVVHIFNHLLKKQPNAMLILVGSGPNVPAIQQLITQLKIQDQVILTGVLDDIPAILNALDVYVFPSLFEGFPLTLLEAQASGLPCIVSDTITHDIALTDRVIPCSLSASLDTWIEQILSAPISDQREAYAQQVRDAGYDVQTSMQRLLEVYHAALEDHADG